MKIAILGAAAALTLGVMAGQTMHPDLLTSANRPQGPQMYSGASGERLDGPVEGADTLAAYHGQLPAYVLGTDWQRGMAAPDAPPMKARVDDEPAKAAGQAHDWVLSVAADDAAVAERTPDNPTREPVSDQPALPPGEPAGH